MEGGGTIGTGDGQRRGEIKGERGGDAGGRLEIKGWKRKLDGENERNGNRGVGREEDMGAGQL